MDRTQRYAPIGGAPGLDGEKTTKAAAPDGRGLSSGKLAAAGSARAHFTNAKPAPLQHGTDKARSLRPTSPAA